jgi:hypothetical protein
MSGGYNRKLPPDDMLVGFFRDGRTSVSIADEYNTTLSAVQQAKIRLVKHGRLGADAPVRRYPEPDERRTVRASELQIRYRSYNIFISLPRIPTVDGAFQERSGT